MFVHTEEYDVGDNISFRQHSNSQYATDSDNC